MERTLGSAVLSIPPGKKASARVALIDIQPTAHRVLTECFRQFGLESILMSSDSMDRLQKEKFDACVVKVNKSHEPFMQTVRTSPSNSRMVMYGLGGTAQDSIGFSKYGLNAIFHEPLERQAALKLVRATQPLVMHEFRRYVRIPIITEVNVSFTDGHKINSTSQEISAGGMSLRSNEDIAANQGVEISFALLTLPRLWVRGNVCWRKPHSKSFGVRFDVGDERRFRIKEWVDAFLEC